MNKDKKILKIVTNENIEIEYNIIMSFKSKKTNNNYVIYTDNTYDNDKLNIYASIYYPNDNTKLDKIETEEEWQEVEKALETLSIN